MKQSKQPLTSSAKRENPFQQWYEAKFNKRMPIYLPNLEKKKLLKQYANECKAK